MYTYIVIANCFAYLNMFLYLSMRYLLNNWNCRLHQRPSDWGRDIWMLTSAKPWVKGQKAESFPKIQSHNLFIEYQRHSIFVDNKRQVELFYLCNFQETTICFYFKKNIFGNLPDNNIISVISTIYSLGVLKFIVNIQITAFTLDFC